MAYKWHSGLSPKHPPSVWGYLVQFSFELMTLLIFCVEFIEFMLQILASNSVCSKSQGKPFFAREGEVCWCLLCKNDIPRAQVQPKI